VARSLQNATLLSKEEEAALFELPDPSQMVGNDGGKVRITLMLDRSSIDFFKSRAARENTRYQTMINQVLKSYAAKYRNKSAIASN
jgi:uncharacterized protein (DUF4415 family)